jgi:F-type H+-transporting ATPase subunit gamma
LAENIILHIDQAMTREKVTHVMVFTNRRIKNQPVKVEKRQVLPFNTQALKNLKNKPWPTNNIPLITLPTAQMFSALVREMMLIFLSDVLNGSLAAEHWTRMTNMQNAEKNIDDNLEELDKQYQQKRQEQITEELIDVVSGASALKK